MLAVSCRPAESDIEVEKVDTAYVNHLPEVADSVIDLIASADKAAPGAVMGRRYLIGGKQKELTIWWNEQQQPMLFTERQRGKLTDSVAFYDNGQRIFRLNIGADGRAEGPARFYFSNGRVREDGRFSEGLRKGIWRLYNEQGKLIRTQEYDRYGRLRR